MEIKKNDIVKIISGKLKGYIGKITSVNDEMVELITLEDSWVLIRKGDIVKIDNITLNDFLTIYEKKLFEREINKNDKQKMQ